MPLSHVSKILFSCSSCACRVSIPTPVSLSAVGLGEAQGGGWKVLFFFSWDEVVAEEQTQCLSTFCINFILYFILLVKKTWSILHNIEKLRMPSWELCIRTINIPKTYLLNYGQDLVVFGLVVRRCHMYSKALGKQILHTAWRESFVKAPWSINLLKSHYWQIQFINIFVHTHIGRVCSSKFIFFLVYSNEWNNKWQLSKKMSEICPSKNWTLRSI